jgi:hypothetical protein
MKKSSNDNEGIALQKRGSKLPKLITKPAERVA